jgi:hypothetical protein
MPPEDMKRIAREALSSSPVVGGGEGDLASRITGQDQCGDAGPVPALPEVLDLTGQILEALRKRADERIWASELAFDGGARRCDFWTISANGSEGFQAVAYEIKISRGDFKRDTHAKQRQARLFSDRFYYVAPTGLIKPDELPDWAGLIEFDGEALSIKVAAPHRDKDAPTWQLVVSLIRNSGEIRRDTDLLRKENARLKRVVGDVKDRLRAKGLQPWEYGIW